MSKSMKFKSVYVVLLLALLLSVLPSAGGGVALAAAGDLVPLGNQLGDVGQYYSQVAPSMKSRIHIRETTGTARNVVITLRDETGVVATTFTCGIAGFGLIVIKLAYADGSIVVDGDTNACDPSSKVHGVYILSAYSSDGSMSLAASVDVWHNADGEQTQTSIAGYRPEEYPSLIKTFPALITNRNTGNWWDSEIVVVNSGSTYPTTVKFNICNASGVCFNNNAAILQPQERRIFLMSQLAYKPDGAGGIVEATDGWFRVDVESSPYLGYAAQKIFAVANVFSQAVAAGDTLPKSEKGSLQYYAVSASPSSTELWVPGVYFDQGGPGIPAIQIGEEGGSPITATVYDPAGIVRGTYGPFSPANFGFTQLWLESLFPALSGTYSIKLTSAAPFTAVFWAADGGNRGHYGFAAIPKSTESGYGYFPDIKDNYYGFNSTRAWSAPVYTPGIRETIRSTNGGSLGYQDSFPPIYGTTVTSWQPVSSNASLSSQGSPQPAMIKNYSATTGQDFIYAYTNVTRGRASLFIPFAPAPVIQFDETPPYYQSYGLPIPFGALLNRADTPGWVEGMNWYNWSKDSCDDQYYIPMDSSIENDVPSRCAGRPLLLANEPDVSVQASMTNEEVARHAFYHRGWPGKLFSPAYNCIRPDGQNCLGYAFWQTPLSKTFNAHKTIYENVWGALPYDGLATHQYVYRPTAVGSGSSYRSGLQQFKDLANSYGWEIWVTEFGWYPWDQQGSYYVNEQYIANNIGDLADAISAVLVQGKLMYFSHHSCWETNPPSDRSCKRYPYRTPTSLDYNAWDITQMFDYDHTVCNGNSQCGAASWTCPDSNSDGQCDLTTPVGNAWKSYMDTH